jgi:hypothetical protein
MNYVLLSSFVRKFDNYNKEIQELITVTIEKIKDYLETNRAPYGLRIKKLSGKIYEARINIHMRIAYFREQGTVKFFCLGSHDDITRCLKNLKQIL